MEAPTGEQVVNVLRSCLSLFKLGGESQARHCLRSCLTPSCLLPLPPPPHPVFGSYPSCHLHQRMAMHVGWTRAGDLPDNGQPVDALLRAAPGDVRESGAVHAALLRDHHDQHGAAQREPQDAPHLRSAHHTGTPVYLQAIDKWRGRGICTYRERRQLSCVQMRESIPTATWPDEFYNEIYEVILNDPLIFQVHSPFSRSGFHLLFSMYCTAI